MSLTPTQRATVLAAVNANPTALAFKQAGDTYSLRAWLNEQPASGGMSAWRTDAPVAAILDSITWANYTPNDAPDATTIWLNRALASQIKQMNLQIMLQGRASVDASKATFRAGLRDAVIALPTGAGGAVVTAGGASGATTLGVCTRIARRVEAVLAGAAEQTGTVTANLLIFEGSADDADAAWLVNN